MVVTGTEQSVNMTAFDAIILDYLRKERLIEVFFYCLDVYQNATTVLVHNKLNEVVVAFQQDCNGKEVARCLSDSVREAFEQRNIPSALEILQKSKTNVLDDPQLFFQLKRQQITECLRAGTIDGRTQALACIRNELAPLALEAYPQAYHLFQLSMLMFVYGEGSENSPVADEWKRSTYQDLADRTVRTLREALNLEEPHLGLLLRYLLLAHAAYKGQKGSGVGQEELIGQLLSPGRRAPHPYDWNVPTMHAIPEKDIQDLAQGVGVQRQEAVLAMRAARGDVVLALKRELGAVQINRELLDQLVKEYAAYRDLIDVSEEGAEASSSGQGNVNMCTSSPGSSTLKLPCWRGRRKVTAKDGHKHNMAATEHAAHVHSVSVGDHIVMGEGVSVVTSPSEGEPEGGQISQGQDSPWGGRATQSTASCDDVEMSEAADSVRRSSREVGLLLSSVREKVEQGRAEEVAASLLDLNPHFFSKHPKVAFELWRAQFCWLVSEGRGPEAVVIARTHLTPLTQSHPHLLPALKPTLALLFPPATHQVAAAPPSAPPPRQTNSDSTALERPGVGYWTAGRNHHAGKSQSQKVSSGRDEVSDSVRVALCEAVTELQSALRRAVGVQEPRLVALLKSLLTVHGLWFKLQRCKDRFETALGIDKLKVIEGSSLNSMSRGTPRSMEEDTGPDMAGPPAPDNLLDEYDEDSDGDEGDDMLSDEAILLTMEFTGLPRSQVIELLLMHDGDPNAVMAGLFP